MSKLLAKQAITQPPAVLQAKRALAMLAYLSLYLNSIFAAPIYENGVLVGVENTTNFFFTYKFVIDLKFTEIWQWYAYLGVIFAAACIFIALFYIPVFVRYFKHKKESVNR